MAAQLQTSSGGAEGGPEGSIPSDDLREFFDQNKLLKMEWYDMLVRGEIVWEELMDSTGKDLEGIFDEYAPKLGTRARTRILNAVRKHPDSTMYKLMNNAKVSVVSSEEHEAAEEVQRESVKISEALNVLKNTMDSLDGNSQNMALEINSRFDEMVTATNKRREEILKELEKVRDSKHSKLVDQQNEFEERAKRLDAFYKDTQSMMKDTTMDPTKRKIQILQQKQEILKQQTLRISPVTNDSIVVNLDIHGIKAKISRIGSVMDGNGALPPTLRIKDRKHDAVTVVVTANEDEKECMDHKVEYVRSDGDHVDDEKVEWKAVNIGDNNNDSVQYVLGSLDKATNYRVIGQSGMGTLFRTDIV